MNTVLTGASSGGAVLTDQGAGQQGVSRCWDQGSGGDVGVQRQGVAQARGTSWRGPYRADLSDEETGARQK